MSDMNMNFEYEKTSKFREVEMGHAYLDTDKTPSENPFSKNVSVKAHTEHTAIKNDRVEAPAVVIDISKTLFDKKTEKVANEETP